MASYKEEFKSYTDWGTVIVRSNKTPLDRSSIFGSLEDAKKYAKGDGSDSRALGKTSYVGQIIAVHENGIVDIYQIIEDRTLRKIIHENDLNLKSEEINNTILSTKNELDEKIDSNKNELEEKIQFNNNRLISQEGSAYDCANGVLTLKTEDPSNTITIQLTGDYGTF